MQLCPEFVGFFTGITFVLVLLYIIRNPSDSEEP